MKDVSSLSSNTAEQMSEEKYLLKIHAAPIHSSLLCSLEYWSSESETALILPVMLMLLLLRHHSDFN
jgi:hypothetical protein